MCVSLHIGLYLRWGVKGREGRERKSERESERECERVGERGGGKRERERE